jgi:hypothetical protein
VDKDFSKVLQPDPAARISVIGNIGTGKSVYRQWFQKNIYRNTLWNPMGDGHIGDERFPRPITVFEYREHIDEFRRGPLHVTVEPSRYDEDTGGIIDEFDLLCACVEEVGAQHFSIEEIALVADSTRMRCPPHFNRLCIRGRHRAVSMSVYGQRFHQFPPIYRGNTSEIVAYRQADWEDVKDFDKRISPARSPIPINHLPNHYFVHWTPEEGARLCEPVPYKAPKEGEDYEQVEPTSQNLYNTEEKPEEVF